MDCKSGASKRDAIFLQSPTVDVIRDDQGAWVLEEAQLLDLKSDLLFTGVGASKHLAWQDWQTGYHRDGAGCSDEYLRRLWVKTRLYMQCTSLLAVIQAIFWQALMLYLR